MTGEVQTQIHEPRAGDGTNTRHADLVLTALQSCAVFKTCSHKTVEHAMKHAELARFHPGQSIFRLDEPSTYFYILVAGEVEISIHNQVVGTYKAPGFIGGLTSVVNVVDAEGAIIASPSSAAAATTAGAGKSQQQPAEVKAAESYHSDTYAPDRRSFTHKCGSTDVAILKISAHLFVELSRLDPNFHLGVMRYFAEKVRSKNARLAAMIHEQKTGGKADTIIISVYDAKKYARAHFTKAFKDATLEGKRVTLHFLAAKLNKNTVALAVGSDAICMFVNDVADADVIRALKVMGVELILLRCAGFNNVDMLAAQSLGISVARVPAYSPHAVAEHAFALLMGVTRKTNLAFNRVRDGNFTLDGLQGRDLNGLTCGVAGTGKIGRCFAAIAHGVGMKLVLWDAFPNEAFAKAIGAKYEKNFDDFVSQCDVISFHLPLTESTIHMFNKDSVERHAKKDLVVINTSRGPIVDGQALLNGILSGKLGGAGLDVYEHEKQYFFEDRSAKPLEDEVLARLVNLPNVLITSHQAFLTSNALEAIAETTRKNAAEYFTEGKRGKQMTNAVLAPTTASKL